MTLDQAQERFRDHPSEQTAKNYLNKAAEYVQDGMIQPDELDRVHAEIEAFRGMR